MGILEWVAISSQLIPSRDFLATLQGNVKYCISVLYITSGALYTSEILCMLFSWQLYWSIFFLWTCYFHACFRTNGLGKGRNSSRKQREKTLEDVSTRKVWTENMRGPREGKRRRLPDSPSVYSSLGDVGHDLPEACPHPQLPDGSGRNSSVTIQN